MWKFLMLNSFVDGSSFIVNGKRYTRYAVTTLFEVLEAKPWPSSLSAQAAKLTALTSALKLAERKICNVYSDSCYAFNTCHATGKLWAKRSFVTSAGKRIANGEQILKHLDAIQLPTKVAVIHCRVHQRGNDKIAKGNQQADQAAKEAALKPTNVHAALVIPHCEMPTYEVNPKEKEKFELMEAKEESGRMIMPDGQIAVPKNLLRSMIKTLHETTHTLQLWPWGGLINREHFAPGVYLEAQRITSPCSLGQCINAQKPTDLSLGARPWAFTPFERLQIDYAEMPKVGGLSQMLKTTEERQTDSGQWETEPLEGLKYLFQRRASELAKTVVSERPPREPN